MLVRVLAAKLLHTVMHTFDMQTQGYETLAPPHAARWWAPAGPSRTCPCCPTHFLLSPQVQVVFTALHSRPAQDALYAQTLCNSRARL